MPPYLLQRGITCDTARWLDATVGSLHLHPTAGAPDTTMNSCDGSSVGSSGADLVLGEGETIIENSVDVTASHQRHQRASPSSAAESPVPTMLPEQPEAVRVLTALLRQVPIPEEMSIAILRAEVEESGDANAAHTGGSGPVYPADAFKKVDEHLGLHAPDLPRLARDFRADYYRLRNLFRRVSHQERYQDRHPNRQKPSVALSSSASSPPDDAAALSASISADLVGSAGVTSFDLDLASGSNGGQRNIISPSTPGHARSSSSSPNSGHNDTAAPDSTPPKSLKEDEIDSVLLRRRIMEATSCLLLTCPDNATAWSDRRRALLFAEGDAEGHMSSRKVKSIFISELKFLDLLFTTHSKAPNAWAHRKWICFRIVRDKISWNIRSTTTEDQWYLLQPWAQREIDLCTRVAEQFPNNYFAWAHRYYVISILFNHWPNDGKKYLSDVSVAGSLRSFLAGEVMFIEQWLTTHVSDHAAAHYGTEALRLHLKHGFRSGAGVLRKKTGTAMEWALAVAEGILITSRHLIRRYSSHEVIWNWRRHVGLIFMDIVCGEFGAERLVGNKAEEALNRFLQVHIYEVYDSIANGDSKDSTYKTKIEPEEEERRWTKIHSLTYLLWLLDQLQRRNTLLELANEEDRNRLNTIRDSCKDTLAGDESLSYNTWRLKKVCEGPL